MTDHLNLFRNLTILSLEQATTLPFLTFRLAQEGARVIRIEGPRNPDPNRRVGADVLGDELMRSYFLPNNLGKQAITLDLMAEEGQVILRDLILKLKVDIFACNTLPKTYARLGIDYETLSRLKPDLIWLGITGFGPDSNEAAYDPILQARAGWMDLTGEADDPPMSFGIPMVDLGAAEHAYGQVMKALFVRAATGRGSRIDVSMFQSAVSWLVNPVLLTGLGEHITRHGNTHQFFAPVSVYPTADGYVYIAVGNDRQWQTITQMPDFAHLARDEYRTNAGRIADKDQLNAAVAEVTRMRSTAEWITVFNIVGVPISKVNRMVDVIEDPLVRRGMVSARDPRTGLQVALPPPPAGTIYLDEVDSQMAFPPRLGEHNEAIYGRELGYSEGRLVRLKDEGII